MKATEIKIGKTYEITAGRNKTKVKVVNFSAQNGSWECETENGKTVFVKEAKRFLAEIGLPPTSVSNTPSDADRITVTQEPPETKTSKTTRARTPREGETVSGLEAAFIVLRDAGEPLNIKQIMERINERNLAKLNGKTPEATVSSALQRDIMRKGDASRFEKAGKGLFRAK